MSNLIKKILVPTDFSACAEHALAAAVKLAPKMSAEIHLLTRIHIHPLWDDLKPTERALHPESAILIKETEAELEKLAQKYRTSFVQIRTHYTHGDLVEVVSNYVDNKDIYLIMMGSSGADGFVEWVYGSNAQKIVRHANCPVIVIKHPVEELPFKNIIFASDFQKEAKKPFLRLIDFGRNFGAHIHLLNIAAYPKFKVSEEDLARMKEFEKMCWALPCFVHGVGDIGVELGITHFATESQADLVAISHRGESPIRRMMLGSISEALVNHMEIPVMTLSTKMKERIGA